MYTHVWSIIRCLRYSSLQPGISLIPEPLLIQLQDEAGHGIGGLLGYDSKDKMSLERTQILLSLRLFDWSAGDIPVPEKRVRDGDDIPGLELDVLTSAALALHRPSFYALL